MTEQLNNIDKPSLVLDIDETLIKSTMYTLPYIKKIENMTNGEKIHILNLDPILRNIISLNNLPIKHDNLFLTTFTIDKHVYIVMSRPYLKEFILLMHQYFNIHVYSLGMNDYIDTIIDAIIILTGINPFINIIANTKTNRLLNKKLINLEIGLSNVLIIDDRTDVWTYDKHNVLQILPYKLYEIFDNVKIAAKSYNILNEYELSDDIELIKITNAVEIYFKKYEKIEFNIFLFKKILYALR